MPPTRGLEPLILEYLAQRAAMGWHVPSTTTSKRNILNSFSNHLDNPAAADLTPGDVEEWLRSILELAPSTQSTYGNVVAQFCRWLVVHGHVADSPVEGVRIPRKPRRAQRTLTASEVAQLLDACSSDLRDEVIIWLMLGLALRRVEVARARWEHYHWREQTLFVRGKADHERIVPVITAVGAVLDRLRPSRAQGPIVLSRTNPGEALGSNGVSIRVDQLLYAAKIKTGPNDGISCHTLRRTAANDILDATDDIRAVQSVLGHASQKTTELYLRPTSLRRLRDAMSARSYTPAPLAPRPPLRLPPRPPLDGEASVPDRLVLRFNVNWPST